MRLLNTGVGRSHTWMGA